MDYDEKTPKELCFITLKCEAKFEEKLTLCSENDMGNLVDVHPTFQTSKNFIWMSYFCPKYLMFELKKQRGVNFHETE